MEKLFTRKEAAKILGISIATLDTARNNGLISYVQYVQNGCVYFTDASLQEYIAKFTHRAKPVEKCTTYRKARTLVCVVKKLLPSNGIVCSWMFPLHTFRCDGHGGQNTTGR